MNWTWTKFKSQAAKNKFELEQILGLFLKKKNEKKNIKTYTFIESLTQN